VKLELAEAVRPSAFEARYRADPDPWNYASSPYERSKYSVTVDALSRSRYGTAFEPACSVGELTAMLAGHCDELLAIDVSAAAVERARRRCAELKNVRVECRDVLTQPRDECFDLIVFSEVGYYFNVDTLTSLARRLGDSVNPDGELIAVHWRGHSAEHVLHGDEVHSVLVKTLRMRRGRSEVHPGFRLDSWLKA
jgi:SAM-dependent methyltransferase